MYSTHHGISFQTTATKTWKKSLRAESNASTNEGNFGRVRLNDFMYVQFLASEHSFIVLFRKKLKHIDRIIQFYTCKKHQSKKQDLLQLQLLLIVSITEPF